MQATLDGSNPLRDVWRRGFEDGLTDMAIGLLLLNVQLGGWLDELGLTVAWRIGVPTLTMVAILLGLKFTKQRLSTPRLGDYRIERSRRRRLLPVMLVSVSITVALVLFTLASTSGMFPDGIPTVLIILGVFGLKAIVLLSLAGWYFGVPRLHAYGWLIAWAIIGSELLIRGTDLSLTSCYLLGFGSSSTIITAVGCVQFARFLRRYPLPPSEAQA